MITLQFSSNTFAGPIPSSVVTLTYDNSWEQEPISNHFLAQQFALKNIGPVNQVYNYDLAKMGYRKNYTSTNGLR